MLLRPPYPDSGRNLYATKSYRLVPDSDSDSARIRQIETGAQYIVRASLETKLFVELLASFYRQNSDRRTRLCNFRQVPDDGIHHHSTMTAASKIGMHNHIRDVEVQNSIADDPRQSE